MISAWNATDAQAQEFKENDDLLAPILKIFAQSSRSLQATQSP